MGLKTYEIRIKVKGCNSTDVRVNACNFYEAEKLVISMYGGKDNVQLMGCPHEIKGPDHRI